MKLHLHRHGDRVLIGPEVARIEGTVTACELQGLDYSKVIYLVSWWDDKTRRQEWFDACMVDAADEQAARAVLSFDGEIVQAKGDAT